MIDRPARRRLIGLALYLGLALVLILLRLLPLSPGRIPWPGPDLILCLTLGWTLRRPDQVPPLAIAAAVLAEDLLLLRPIGLWAAITVLGAEAARARGPRWREHPFVVEWLRVAVLMALMAGAERVLAAMALLPLPSFGQTLLHLMATVAAYPLVVAALWLIGVRRAGPGEENG